MEEETNAEAQTVTITDVKDKKADAKDKDAPKSHANIVTCMVAVHTAVLNVSPKEPSTKTPPLLKTYRETAP